MATSGATMPAPAQGRKPTKVMTISSRGTTILKLRPPTLKQSKRKPYTKVVKTLISDDYNVQKQITTFLPKTRPFYHEDHQSESTNCEVEMPGRPGLPQSGKAELRSQRDKTLPKSESILSKVSTERGAKDKGDKDPVTNQIKIMCIYKPSPS